MEGNSRPPVRRFVDHDAFDLAYIDGRQWRVQDGFTYWLNAVEFVTIPTGFITDFASIPRPLQVLWPSPGGPWDLPAVVHDYLYRYAVVTCINGRTRTITRSDADDELKHGMEWMQTRWIATRCIYRGVRIGGWRAWHRYRNAEWPS